jgi:two-component system chemotaxis response regulator CheB
VAEDARIRVLIVDDSLVAREMLAQILQTDPEIEVVGMARDGQEAVDAVAHLRPDLVTMDIHMPKMDGLEATESIMAYNPTPILVVSSSVYGEGMGRAFDALKMGALEVIKKPEPRDWAELDRIGSDVIRKVKLLSRVRVITHIKGRHRYVPSSPISPAPEQRYVPAGTRSLVAIGSSTGGPTALLAVLGRLPADLSVPVVIAQHIADGFVPGLVSWLDSGCPMHVRMAEDGAIAEKGSAYFAPTGCNLEVDGTVMRFRERRPGQLYIPSADTLFESVARSFGRRAVGVILTGMGADGANGLKLMRDTGAATIGQDEATSTVWGMPQAAQERGAVDSMLPVHEIAAEISRLVSGIG